MTNETPLKTYEMFEENVKENTRYLANILDSLPISKWEAIGILGRLLTYRWRERIAELEGEDLDVARQGMRAFIETLMGIGWRNLNIEEILELLRRPNING